MYVDDLTVGPYLLQLFMVSTPESQRYVLCRELSLSMVIILNTFSTIDISPLKMLTQADSC